MPIAENSSLRSPLDRRNIMEYHRSFDLYFDCPVRLRTICICSVPVEGFILSGHHILPACIESCELGLMPLKSHWSHDHSPFLCIGTSKNRGYPKKIIPPGFQENAQFQYLDTTVLNKNKNKYAANSHPPVEFRVWVYHNTLNLWSRPHGRLPSATG